jgi:lysophospholipase L1-like esterase
MAGTVLRRWIDRTPRRGPWLIIGALVAVTGALTGGYLLGASSAPDEHDARAELAAATRSAFKRAYATGYDRGLSRGRAAGATAGRRAGETRGAREGRAAAKSAIHRARVLAKRRARVLAKHRARVLAKARRSAAKSESEPGATQASGPPLPGSGGVLVVGDSLEVLTSPYLQKYLPSASLTINAEGGYNSLQIYKLFQQSYDPSQSVIVFDAGTNDNPAYPEILAGRLQAVAQQIGNRCMVVPTIHGLTVNGIDSAGKNRAVREFAASRPGTQTPDWARVVKTHPELMQSDDLHPVPEGANYRARLIARGVKACLAQGSSSGLGFGQ